MFFNDPLKSLLKALGQLFRSKAVGKVTLNYLTVLIVVAIVLQGFLVTVFMILWMLLRTVMRF